MKLIFLVLFVFVGLKLKLCRLNAQSCSLLLKFKLSHQ